MYWIHQQYPSLLWYNYLKSQTKYYLNSDSLRLKMGTHACILSSYIYFYPTEAVKNGSLWHLNPSAYIEVTHTVKKEVHQAKLKPR